MSKAPERLGRYSVRLSPQEREAVLEGLPAPKGAESTVVRPDGSSVALSAFQNLMVEAERRRAHGEWSDRSESDRWLAPRLHYALRLSRAEAADKGTWLWLALKVPGYVQWRWDGEKSVVEDRWYGPVHKQALARLWWGGELFRDGADYGPVVRAFVRQDLPNSYLHRPVVRCRSLALGVLDVIAPAGRETDISSKQVNNLAAMLNLTTAGAPPEAATDYVADDVSSYHTWITGPAAPPANWEELPAGPPCEDTTETSRNGGKEIADRGWGYALKYRAQTKSKQAQASEGSAA